MDTPEHSLQVLIFKRIHLEFVQCFSRRMPCGKSHLHSSLSIDHSKSTAFLHRLPQPPFELLVRRVQETPQTVQVSANALGCLPEFEGETVLLKIPETSDTGLGGIELDLTWKPPTQGPALTVSEGSMQAARKEKQSMVLPSCKATLSQLSRLRMRLTTIKMEVMTWRGSGNRR